MWHFDHSLSCFEESHNGTEPEPEWTNQPLQNLKSRGNPEILVGMSHGDLEVLGLVFVRLTFQKEGEGIK